MQAETLPPNPESALLKAYLCYRCLIEGCACAGPTETGLGGKLLYAGELDPVGSAITLAGNVAGCATLAATADAAAQKQAIRNGIVDFLVTSLDEALRILKNEIRKHATVAVCVGVSTGEIEREMQERGVQPDLGRESAICRRSETEPQDSDSIPNTLVWRVESSPAKWLPNSMPSPPPRS